MTTPSYLLLIVSALGCLVSAQDVSVSFETSENDRSKDENLARSMRTVAGLILRNKFESHNDKRSLASIDEFLCYNVADKHNCLGTAQLGNHVLNVTTSRSSHSSPADDIQCWAFANGNLCRSCSSCGDHGIDIDCSNVLMRSHCARVDCNGQCHGNASTSVLGQFRTVERSFLAGAMACVIIWGFSQCLMTKFQLRPRGQVLSTAETEIDAVRVREERKRLIEASLFTEVVTSGDTAPADRALVSYEEVDNDMQDVSLHSNSSLPKSVDNYVQDYLEVPIEDGTIMDEEEPTGDICHICLDCFRNGQESSRSRASNCGHAFHHACIVAWLERHDDCPCCRASFLVTSISIV